MGQLWINAGLVTEAGLDTDEVSLALHTLAASTVKEAGCIKFEVLQHQDNPSRFTLWEHWVSSDALSAHFEAEHTLAYLARNLTKVTYVEKLTMVTNEEK
ncbi:antibiotic biosynthesis monooxygenase [Shewanella benthica]|uniref:putative quinol monooxygenase n=1 Tax=Shewanella benthica TaxID=43661 RepID=UPI001879C6A0|nr:putative quinol monooxygenase [Shewanella benthica]MBE7216016.1 antibiotic biosynthesis monooxygenase [Shewanella benthica]MCL1063722.1 antibiotic biosynthesis monooxygenase [Shewanella benthica]